MNHSTQNLKRFTTDHRGDAIFDLVVKGINAQLHTHREMAKDNLLREELGLPSLKLVMFFTGITAELGISIMDFSDYELLRLKTVGDVSDLLISKLR